MKAVQEAGSVASIAKCRAAKNLLEIIQIVFDAIKHSLIQRRIQPGHRLLPIWRMYDDFRQHWIVKRGNLDPSFHPGLNTRFGWAWK
jgi:hypothetical protein